MLVLFNLHLLILIFLSKFSCVPKILFQLWFIIILLHLFFLLLSYLVLHLHVEILLCYYFFTQTLYCKNILVTLLTCCFVHCYPDIATIDYQKILSRVTEAITIKQYTTHSLIIVSFITFNEFLNCVFFLYHSITNDSAIVACCLFTASYQVR